MPKSKIKLQCELVFVRAGIKQQDGTPYFCVSNGRKEIWFDLSGKSLPDNLVQYKEDKVYKFDVEVLVGSPQVRIVEWPEKVVPIS